MNTHLDPDHAYGLELLAAVNALRPDAAPLAAALVRGSCVLMPNPEALLVLLDGLGHADTAAGTEAAHAAMLAAWRGAQGRAPGAPANPAPWQALAAMGLAEQAQAAVLFGFTVAHAGMQRATSDEAGPLLH